MAAPSTPRVQIDDRVWNSTYCFYQDLAAETRAKVLTHAASAGALLLPAHFCGPACGYIRPATDGYSFEPPAVWP